jgi:hypothetical protein
MKRNSGEGQRKEVYYTGQPAGEEDSKHFSPEALSTDLSYRLKQRHN